jgi:hypothetical protein
MRRPAVHPVVLLVLVASLALAACESSREPSPAPSVGGAASDAPSATPVPTASDAAEPSLTPVPGGQTIDPGPLPTRTGTVQTEWGEILVALPASFPIHPQAGSVDLPGTATASLSVPVDLEAATDWYVEALGGKGYQLDLSDPLESGTRVLDVASDVPECRIRMDFRPEADSTIMTVLYGAGCAGLGG